MILQNFNEPFSSIARCEHKYDIAPFDEAFDFNVNFI